MEFGVKFGRRTRFWRYFAILCGAVIVALIRNWALDVPESVSGRAHIVDGDSLRVGGEEIRLVGIDAPEGQQLCTRNEADWACGRDAARALRKAIGGRTVVCAVEGLDRYERLLAVCSAGNRELNEWMVRNGWAVSYGRYRSEERDASAARRGIWDSSFERPQVWRNENLTGSMAASAS